MAHGVSLLAALIAVGPDRAAKEPTYKVELRKAADSVVTQKENDRTVFVITSESGIGGAVIVFASGAWPEKVTLRFRDAEGKAYRTLEDIRLWTDRVLVQGAQKMSGRMPFCFVGVDGKSDAIEPGGAEAAGLLDVRVHRGERGLDVTLPAHVLTGSGKLRLSWIDALRR
jgi:hypothetical protein